MKSNIPGFPNYYVSKSGKLFGYNKILKRWKKLSDFPKNNGYISNILWGENIKKNIYRHRLVAEAYIPNPHNYPIVCHKDNNRTNNHVSNLYWGTELENMGQAVADGSYSRGWDKRGRISIDERLLCKKYLLGKHRKELLKEFDISVGTYYKVLRNNSIIPNRYGEKDKRNKR